MVWKKVVSPVKTGVQGIYKYLKRLDSGRCDSKPSFRRNDDLQPLSTFYEFIKIQSL